jgi:hypothetical protein
VIIPPRYNGPPESANGGYTAGLLARYVGAPEGTVVTLHRPPPLATPLDVVTTNGDVDFVDGDTLVASGSPTPDPLIDAVPPVSFTDAMAAAETYPGLTAHPFPTCFVCGPERPPGDGLRIFAGRLPDGRTAAPWVVPDEVEPALVWAALDCPGGWAIALEGRPYVLGRIAARVDALPAAGDGCVVMGALLAEEGRKAYVISSLYGADGGLLALARSTWIAVRT